MAIGGNESYDERKEKAFGHGAVGDAGGGGLRGCAVAGGGGFCVCAVAGRCGFC